MAPHAPKVTIHQRARRLRAALRSLRPSSVVAVTLALVFGGTTMADAANGGNFLLGKANIETATATLTNTQGTPLKLADSQPRRAVRGAWLMVPRRPSVPRRR